MTSKQAKRPFLAWISLLFVLILTHSTRADQRVLDAEVIGKWPPFGVYQVTGPIAVKDQLAFLPLRDGVRVLDVTTPADPKLISTIPGSPTRIAVRDDYLYVTDPRSGLEIFSIANPQNPSLVSTQALAIEPFAVSLSGNYALVSDLIALSIIDVSNPGTPFLAGSTNMFVADIDTARGHAFVVGGEGLQIIDLSDPANLRVVGVYAQSSRRVAVSGDRAFVITSGRKIHEVDISNPSNPTFVREFGFQDYADVAVVGNYLYAVGPFADYEIFDVTSPLPFPVSAKYGANEALGITISGGHAYISDATASIRIVDVRDPANAEYVYYINGWTQNVLVNPPYAYITEANDGGFRVLDVTDPAAPRQVGRLAGDFYLFAIARSGNYIYALQNPGGLRVLDVSNPANPHSVGFLPLESNGSSIAIDGGHAAISLSDGSFILVDISNPASPQIRSTTPGAAVRLAYANSRVYVMTTGSLRIYDVSNPATPTLLGGEFTIGPNREIALYGNYALIASVGQGLQVLDVSNPAAPRPVGRLDIITDTGEDFTPSEITVSGRFAIISALSFGFVFVDLFDPAHPTFAGRFQDSDTSFAYSAAAAGDLVYIAHNVQRFKVLKTRELPAAHPSLIARAVLAPRTKTKVVVHGDVAYATSTAGVVAIDVSNPMSPSKLMDLPTTSSERLHRSGNLLAVGPSNAQIDLFDITNPRSPQKVGSIPVPIGVGINPTVTVDFKLQGSYAYVLIFSNYDHSHELQVFDLTNPAAPQKIGARKSLGGYEPVALAISGNLAALVTRVGFVLIDISNPAAPAFRSEMFADFGIYNTAAFAGNRLYVGGERGVRIFDISNPASTRFLSHYSIPFGWRPDVSEMQIVQNRIYLAYMGLQVIDASDPLNPTWIGGYSANGSGGIDVSGDLAFLALSGDFTDLEVLKLNLFPTLEIRRIDAGLMLRWPTNFANVTLHSAASLNGPWTQVTGTRNTIDGNFSLIIPDPETSPRFYRLVGPSTP